MRLIDADYLAEYIRIKAQEYRAVGNEYMEKVVERIVGIIEVTPTAAESWKPVFEEEIGNVKYYTPKPEAGERVIVSLKDGSVDFDEAEEGIFGIYLFYHDWDDVAAWMPLPEPYKEDKDV